MAADEDDTLAEWAAAVADALDLPAGTPVDIALLLDVARVAAHGVARPAAPLTTFLVGYAAARNGGTAADVDRAVEAVLRLAEKTAS